MERETVSGIMLTLLLIGIIMSAFNIQPVEAEPTTWTVDDDGAADFSKIQDAVDVASPGDTIYVYNGTYYEKVLVEKAISLKGESKEATIIDGEAGAAFRLYASYVNITGFTLQGGGEYSEGIYLYTGSSWNIVSGNIIKGKNAPYARGIDLQYSNNNTIQDNVIRNSTKGFNLWECFGNTIRNNNITDSWVGIYQQHSGENLICSNNIAGAPANPGAGIQIDWDGRNIISNNSIMGNDYGILLQGSNENCVSSNNIVNNDEGIHVYESSGNLLYHNNFIANTHQVRDANWDYPNVSPSTNTWDDGYPSGGNYWSDYAGVDIKNGPNQDQPGSDGIGDTPFVIDANNQDNYPLKSIWGRVIDVEPPVADAGPDLTINSGTTITFNGSKSVDNFAIKNYVWTFTDLTPQILTGMHPSYTFNNVGHFEVTLNVSDYVGNWDTDTVAITVEPPENELVASITAPTSLQLGASSTLKATVTNQGPDDATNVKLVLFINGTEVDSTTVPLLQTGSSYMLSYLWTPTVAGTYNITAYVHPVPGEVSIEDNQMAKTVTVVAPLPPPEVKVGIKAGDWIKCTYTISGWPSGTPYPEWLKLEFLSVEGTTAKARVTMRMSNGTELSETVPIDFVSGGKAFGLSGFLIPANSTVGDSITMGGAGFNFNVTIEGETTRNYAGASRTVIYARFSQYGTEFIYYWDKQTGIMVEATTVYRRTTASAKATETNMWQADSSPFWTQWWFYAIVAVVIVALGGAVHFLKKRKPPIPTVTPTLPTEGT